MRKQFFARPLIWMQKVLRSFGSQCRVGVPLAFKPILRLVSVFEKEKMLSIVSVFLLLLYLIVKLVTNSRTRPTLYCKCIIHSASLDIKNSRSFYPIKFSGSLFGVAIHFLWARPGLRASLCDEDLGMCSTNEKWLKICPLYCCVLVSAGSFLVAVKQSCTVSFD